MTNLKEILGRVVYANNCLDYDARPEIYTDVFRLYDNLFESQEKRKNVKWESNPQPMISDRIFTTMLPELTYPFEFKYET